MLTLEVAFPKYEALVKPWPGTQMKETFKKPLADPSSLEAFQRRVTPWLGELGSRMLCISMNDYSKR